MRQVGENASQISDEESQGGICSSCRLAVNKDTGRLKWCMGSNNIWRTRIRFMLLIPAVILPITIIVIALSKSTVIGKLSMRPSQENEKEDEPTTTLNYDQSSRFTIQSDIEHYETTSRVIHPDMETSFIPSESFIIHPNRQRRKRYIDQKQTRSTTTRPELRMEMDAKAHSLVGEGIKTPEMTQELQVNFSRGRSKRDSDSSESDSSDSNDACDSCESEEDDSESDSTGDNDDDDDDDDDDDNDNDDDDDDEISEENEEDEEDDENRAASKTFVINSAPRDDNESIIYNNAQSEIMNSHSFWDGDWNENYIRTTQANAMRKYMDKTIDPCQDFYQYACGNWQKYNPIPKDKAGLDTFETRRESLYLVLRQLLEEPEKTDNPSSAIVKTKNMFRSCMNYEILEQRMEKPLLEILDELGGWPIIQPHWDNDNFDWILLTAKLRLYNNPIFINEWVGPDIENNEQFMIQFNQASLGLPSKDYFLKPTNAIYLMAYKDHLITTATLLGASLETAKIQAEELIAFEMQLANISKLNEEKSNLTKYMKMTLDRLHKTIPEIDWHRYLSIVLSRPANYSESIILYSTKRYWKDLINLISRTPERTIANYLIWRFVQNRVSNLDNRFLRARQNFYYILLGREKTPPRWKTCVIHVNANMGMAVGSIFVRKYFDKKSKNDTLLMIQEIQHAFSQMLDQLNWLDPIIKQVATEKVSAMQLLIGYPSFILEDDKLNEYYDDVSIHPEKYFENTLAFLLRVARLEQSKLNSQVKKIVWNTSPAVVNAYYIRGKNQISFPAGILQPPFYHRHFPRSLNYGGIGVVIGHEITHGFDDKGRLFDKHGNVRRWWNNNTIKEFDRRASCLVGQYNKYIVKDVLMNINGINTKSENIADNGGIKQAFKAYENWLSLNPNATETLPGIDATGRQLFFINFAQLWCGSMRPEAMRINLKLAPHSPVKYRVIGTLSNFEEFSKVFNCPVGSPMNPEEKCSVW